MSFKNLFGLTELFNPNAPADAPAAHDEAPTLEPIGTRAPPSPGSQWMASLPLIAEKIGDEVRDLREMQGSVNFGFQIWTLTFHVSPANEAALRNPMSLSQRDDGVLKTLVESGFAKSSAAPWLNTQRMKIEFKRSEARLDDAAEVLMSSGSTGVPLQFGYSGQIEVLPAGAQRPGVNALSAHPAIAAAMVAPAAAAGAATGAAINTLAATPASTLTTPPTTHPGPTDVLLLWAQLPGQKQVQRWAFTAGPVNVGADYEATLCVDQHHVSGEHLQLTCDEHGRWQVVDRSRNGSHLLDASAEGATETPLPTHVLRPLPPAGVLRLGPLPDDPLLHIHITPAAPPAPAQAAPGSRGRVTRLATDPAAAPAQFAAAQRRSTSLS